jgi:hypothetical protein
MWEADFRNRKKVLECEESKPAFELKTVSIEQYPGKKMAEFERIDFDHVCIIPDSNLSVFSDVRCKSGQGIRARRREIKGTAMPGGDQEMQN